ncbi:MAG: glycosyltransferase, partial [Alphaproteobacteria bacterium]|nr:glycosyltransferase [Alphaproteobacteria bacterium]
KNAKEKGIDDRIFFHGYTQDVKSAYRNADINAFPSVSEGFALGLADGMAHGLPSIGFATTSSVNEMIRDGENGFLVNSVDEFAEKLALLIKDKDLRIRLGKQAVQDMKPYAPENIMDAWDNLIKETIAPYQK